MGMGSGTDIHRQILAKGWTVRDAAKFWGVSRQRLYQVFKQEAPALLWDCAARGLPEASPQMLALANSRATEKPGRVPPIQKSTNNRITQASGYALGDVLMAATYVGEIADEGEEGVITAIKRSGNLWTFLVRFDRGEDWFPEALICACMAPTGRSYSGD